MEASAQAVHTFLADYSPIDPSLQLRLLTHDEDSFSLTFEAGQAESGTTFVIFCDPSWIPMFVMSDAEILSDWVSQITRTLENDSACKTLSVLMTKIVATLTPILVPKVSRVDDEIALTPEEVEADIRDWCSRNKRSKLSLFRLDQDSHTAMLSLGYVRFQLYFNSNWRPLIFVTENAELESHLTVANLLINTSAYLPHPTPIQIQHDSNGSDTSDSAPNHGNHATDIPTATSPSLPKEKSFLSRLFDAIADGYKRQYGLDLEGEEENEDDLHEEDDVYEEVPAEEEYEEVEEEVEEEVTVYVEDPDALVPDGEERPKIAKTQKHKITKMVKKLKPSVPIKRIKEFKDEDIREPTEEEWTTIVLPAVRKFMKREGFAQYVCDEWERRISQTKASKSRTNLRGSEDGGSTGIAKALQMIRSELIAGSRIPAPLRQFIPTRISFDYMTGASKPTSTRSSLSIQAFLRSQHKKLSPRLVKECGFYAIPLKNDIQHWRITLEFDNSSPLGLSLMQLALQNHNFDDPKTSAPIQSSAMEPDESYSFFDSTDEFVGDEFPLSESNELTDSGKSKTSVLRASVRNNTVAPTSTPDTEPPATVEEVPKTEISQIPKQEPSGDSSTAPPVKREATPKPSYFSSSSLSQYKSSYVAPKKMVEPSQIVIEVMFPDVSSTSARPQITVIRPILHGLPDGFFDSIFADVIRPLSFASSSNSTSSTASDSLSESPYPNVKGTAGTTSSYYSVLATSNDAAATLTSQSTPPPNTGSSAQVPTLKSILGDNFLKTLDTIKMPTKSGTHSIDPSAAAEAISSIVSSVPLPNSTSGDPKISAPFQASKSSDQGHAGGWTEHFDLFQYFQAIRQSIDVLQPKVDLELSTIDFYHTTGFWKRFECVSAKSVGENSIEGKGKVCLPMSCLDLIYSTSRSGISLSQSGNYASPMTFELSAGKFGSSSFRNTYCGVLEFTAEEGKVIVPTWMFDMLKLQQHEEVWLRQLKLPPGDFVKLQPLDDSHVAEGVNPKALLEWKLRDFVALTKGEVLPISDMSHTFRFTVLEVKPGHSIAITDRDINVEFVDPLESKFGAPSTPSITHNTPVPTNHPSTSSPLRTGHLDADGVEGVDVKTCDNCRHKIPMASYVTHSMRCPRMNYFCESCQVAVARSEQANHEATLHAKTECAKCRLQMESRFLSQHATNECPARIVKCTYCELTLPFSSKAEHETACGARTNKCPHCGLRFASRFLQEHVDSGCSKKTEPRHPIYEPQTLPSYNPSNSFVCETCGAPIDSFDELQVHMLTVHYTGTMDVDESITK